MTDAVDSSSTSGFDEAKRKLSEKGVSTYFININTRDFFEDKLLGDCVSAMRFSRAQIERYYASFSKGSNIEKASDFCKLGDFERLAISKKLYELAAFEMNDLAKISGGRVFPAADLSETRSAFKQVAAEIGTRYSLGYYSTNEKRDGKFRAIKVELKGLPAGTQLRAREGYTAPVN
jgi:VWFA-related protein